MPQVDKSEIRKELIQRAEKYTVLFQKAVDRKIKMLKEKGLPIVFSKDGVIYYELPNGEITTKSPFESK